MIYKNILRNAIWILCRNPNEKKMYLYPMKRVRIHNTKINFTAISNIEIVSELRNFSFNKGENLNDFMLKYSKRAVINNNEDIRATDVDSFVNDLITYNHISVEDDIISMN